MSQIYKNSSSGGGGSSINEIDTQSGNATPIANIILFNAYDTTENNLYGIETKGNTNGGNPPGTGAGNETDVYLTNRFHSQTSPGVAGSVTTTDATPTTIATCPMPLFPAVYQFIVNLVAYDVTDNSGGSVVGTVSFLTNGGPPDVLGPDDFIIQQSSGGTFPAATAVTLQGTATTFNVIVRGVAATTIRWLCHGTYTVVS